MVINVFRRYEKKFLLTKAQLEDILPIIEKHMDLDPFCLNGETYTVRTIYFDTPDHDVIRRSIDQPKFKEKLRLRKYGTCDDPSDEVYLEIKRKYQGVGIKRRVKLTLAEANGLIHEHNIPIKEDYYSRQILGEIGYYLQVYAIVPSVFISYERHAYIDRETKMFRLTIDHNIYTRRSNFAFDYRPSGQRLIDDDYRLMEVKVGKAMPLWFAKALSQYKIYLTSFSKYGKEFEKRMKKELDPDEYI